MKMPAWGMEEELRRKWFTCVERTIWVHMYGDRIGLMRRCRYPLDEEREECLIIVKDITSKIIE